MPAPFAPLDSCVSVLLPRLSASSLPSALPPLPPLPRPLKASSFNSAEGCSDGTEMSYLTSVCRRFHGEFANPRRSSLLAPRSSLRARASGHSARFSSLVQSSPGRGKEEAWGAVESTIFPSLVRIFRLFVFYPACDSIDFGTRAEPGLSDSAPTVLTIIQIKSLSKPSLRLRKHNR